MNAKRVKIIRRLCKDLKLNFNSQRLVFNNLSDLQKAQYLKDAKIHINNIRNDRVEQSWNQNSINQKSI